MIKVIKTVDELLQSGESPLPLSVIPNNMGINLCSVETLSWTIQENGELVDLEIRFQPAKNEDRYPQLKILKT